MTVQELIDELQYFDSEMEVEISYPSGDYWGTQIAKPVNYAEEGTVKHSEYHRADKVVDEDSESEDADNRQVVLLSF